MAVVVMPAVPNNEGTDASERLRRIQERLRVLSIALREFAEVTSEHDRLLDVIARTLAETVKDGCVLRLLGADGWLMPPAGMHLPFEEYVADAAAAERVRAHISAPHHLREHSTARQVLETGEPLLVPKLDLAQLRATATPEIVDAFETIGIHSILQVPLRVRGESIGLLSLVRFVRTSGPFNQADVELAQALADHAALAVNNARLLQSAKRELADRERAEAALRKTEQQLRHSQKMEAVGRLAGGVAHDFNNLLSVILSYSEMVRDALDDERLRADVEEIRKAGVRAADLTKQLLAFSRHQVLDVKPLNLSTTTASLLSMLRRLLGADVELVTNLDAELWQIKADAGQIAQIVMNLAVNARDALPSGGRITIQTDNALVDEGSRAAQQGVPAGAYVKLSVIDDGLGMDEDTRAHIFEPFFTTKEQGKGTGLGLAMVFGIVQQSGGHITVRSEPLKGAAFEIYFPRAGETDASSSIAPSGVAAAIGHETILVVEDDEPLRTLAVSILRRAGYDVLEASNAGEALMICEEHLGRIDLLLTDVVLPRINGRQLADRVSYLHPEMKTLFMSGHSDHPMVDGFGSTPGVLHFHKPVTPAALTQRVRETLGTH